jgi:hypothetical protein
LWRDVAHQRRAKQQPRERALGKVYRERHAASIGTVSCVEAARVMWLSSYR